MFVENSPEKYLEFLNSATPQVYNLIDEMKDEIPSLVKDTLNEMRPHVQRFFEKGLLENYLTQWRNLSNKFSILCKSPTVSSAQMTELSHLSKQVSEFQTNFPKNLQFDTKSFQKHLAMAIEQEKEKKLGREHISLISLKNELEMEVDRR